MVIDGDSYSLIWNMIAYLRNIACIGCLCIILVAILKIIFGDENDSKKYLVRIKNALIALVLIFTVIPLANAVYKTIGDNKKITFSVGTIEGAGLDDLSEYNLNNGLVQTPEEALEEALEKVDTSNCLKYKDDQIGDYIPCILYLINGQWYYPYEKVDSSSNAGGYFNNYFIQGYIRLRSLDSDSYTYFMTYPGTEGYETTFIGTKSKSDASFIGFYSCYFIEKPSSFINYSSRAELINAILYEVDGVSNFDNNENYCYAITTTIEGSDWTTDYSEWEYAD